jgi:hypothetical protein
MSVTPQYVMVQRADVQLAGLLPRAEITATPAYTALHGGFKSVALRLPDNCFARSELSAGTNSTTAVLESSCGVPLQVLERTLTQAGLQVLSWSTLMGIEKDQHVPVHVAAQQLGADIVIIINEMYAGVPPAGAKAEASYHYFQSDEKGDRGGPAELLPNDRKFLKTFVRNVMGEDPKANGLKTIQASLNATVVLARGDAGGADPAPGAAPAASTPAAPTPAAAHPAASATPARTAQAPLGRSGEAIWFYNWKLGNIRSKEDEKLFVFAGIPVQDYASVFHADADFDTSDPSVHYWWPVLPLKAEQTAPPLRPLAASEESFSSDVQVGPDEQETLYRKIAEDFITRFKGG